MSRAYAIAVIDDSWSARESDYRLLEKHSDIELTFIQNAAALSDLTRQHYDGFLIDLNLSNWGLTAQDVIRTHIATLRRARPIFLISAHLADNQFNVHAQVAREVCGAAYGDTFAWRDYADRAKGSSVNTSAFEVVYQRILRVLAGWFAQRQLDGTDDIRILHISDPQFGDPQLNEALRFNEEVIAAALHQKLSDTPRSDGSLVDFIVLSGDITYSGQKSEFAKARAWIEDSLVTQIFPSMSRVAALERLYMCPGNHDVNLRVMALSSLRYNFKWPSDKSDSILKPYAGEESSYRHEGLRNYYDFLCAIDREAAKTVHPESAMNWVSDRFLSSGIQFILLNTASSIDCSEPDAAAIDEDEFSTMKQHIRDVRSNADMVTICVGHHPLRALGDGQKSVKNAGAIVTALGAKGVRAYLHGHAHAYALEPLVAGQCVAVMSPTTNVNVKNSRQGFALVTLRKDKKKKLRSLALDICEFHPNSQFQWLTISTTKTSFKFA